MRTLQEKTDFLIDQIDCFPDKNGWWKDENRDIFIKCGKQMLKYDMPVGIVALILEDLYWAVSNEFGM